MNTKMLNTVFLDDDVVVKKVQGGSGGTEIRNQHKKVEITENGTTTIGYDSGYTGLSQVQVVTNVPTSGGSEPASSENDVIFYDYDGTILHSYSKDDFLALNELPPLPTREGLICQEWNYSFEDAQSYVSEYGMLDIGATYITDDGKTRVYINIDQEERMDMPLHFHQTVSRGVVIDWGDGSPTETVEGEGFVSVSHPYASIGEYIITLDAVNGEYGMGEEYDEEYDEEDDEEYDEEYDEEDDGEDDEEDLPEDSLFGDKLVYRGMIHKVLLGENVISVGNGAFSYCFNLRTVSISKGVAFIGAYSFYESFSLECVVLPQGVKNVGFESFLESNISSVSLPSSVLYINNYCFYSSIRLKRITFPSDVTTIRVCTCSDCTSLKDVVIPKKVRRISYRAFSYCPLKSIRLFNGLREINYGVFEGSLLSDVVIPESVEIIDDAFLYNSNIKELTIPSKVNELHISLMSNLEKITILSKGIDIFDIQMCENLKSIEIPDSLSELGRHSFTSCKSLTNIKIPASVSYVEYGFLNVCNSIKFIDFSNHLIIPMIVGECFIGLPQDYEIIVPHNLCDQWKKSTNWSDYAEHIVSDYTPKECTSLTIEADNARGRDTTTRVRYKAITNGVKIKGEAVSGIIVNGTDVSEPFPQNKSYTDTVEREISFTYMGVTAKTTIVQGVWTDSYFDVLMNDEWRISEEVSNPDSGDYEGVYESFSNHGVDDSISIMRINFDGYRNFEILVRSDAESSFDYLMVSQLDTVLTNGDNSNSSSVKFNTRDKQNPGTSIDSYSSVVFTDIPDGEHFITVAYRKDGSSDSGTDRGYVLIPKNQ